MSFRLCFITLLFVTSCTQAQDRFAGVEITATPLTDNIYMLEGSGGNMGLFIGEEETLLIDDQYGPLSEKIATKIEELGGGIVKRLINTHWHGDHSGGNENFANDGAMIIAHENVRNRMSTEQSRGERVTPPSPSIALPVITYSDNISLHLLSEPVLLMHMHNAHTDGDSFVFFPESNVLHMGDCFFHKRYPYIDLFSGGSINGMIDAAQSAMLLCNDETQIIPGHGPMATKADLESYLDFLIKIKARVEEYVTNGRGLDSIDSSKIVEGYEEWAWRFMDADRFTSIVYSSLTNQ